MRSVLLLTLALAGAGCFNRDSGSSHSAAEAAPPAVSNVTDAAIADATSPAAATIDAAPVDCAAYHRALAGEVGRTLRAAGGQAYYQTAADRWRGAPAACRDGAWLLAAARLLRFEPSTALTAGSVKLTGAAAALRAGLAQEPDRDLLVLVAFVSALGDKPALPADACDRVGRAPAVPGPDYESRDRQAYVCGHAALRAGDYPRAREQLAAIEMAQHYPDLPLRRAQAAVCAGKRGASYKHLRAARKLDPTVSTLFGATSAEHDQLVKAARARIDCQR